MAAVLLLPLLFLLPSPSLSISDADTLLLLKSSFRNPDPALSSWTTVQPNSSSPCGQNQWIGIICYHGIVIGLRLGHLGLSGTIDVHALAHLPALRTVSFVNNSLSGPLPDFGRIKALKSLYLSHNNFSGPIPDSLFTPMDHLKKLWLNDNAFSGKIPSSLSNATALLDLHIEDNRFSGVIPNLSLPSLRSFNASNNKLTGPVPASLARFGPPAFLGNSGLCGSPVSTLACPAPTKQKSSTPALTVDPGPTQAPVKKDGRGGFKAVWRFLLIVAAMSIILIFVFIFAFTVNTRRKIIDINAVNDHRNSASAMDAMATAVVVPVVQSSPPSVSPGHKRAGSARGSGSSAGGSSGAVLVMVQKDREALDLPDLMKSAAEVLGNGSLGSAYKAVMAGGFAVVVKRMRHLTLLNKEGFDGEMRRLGRLNHPNILAPLAYHFRKEEKLIVSDYVPKGSLLYALHGGRGAEHAALDWLTRLKIILGIARGMAYLHVELASYEIPHGNLKTANILLSPSFDPLLADYGLIALVSPAAAPAALFSFKSPEAQHLRRVSPKSDVYCFGVVILEILTGRLPSQYLNNAKGGTDVVQWAASAISDRREGELVDPAITGKDPPTLEMVRLLRVGAACTQIGPDERPEMKEAAELVEEIAAAAAAAEGSGWEATGTVGLDLVESSGEAVV